MTTRRREPPEYSARSVLLVGTGAAALGVLLSLSLKDTVSLAVGVALGQVLFVKIVRWLHRPRP